MWVTHTQNMCSICDVCKFDHILNKCGRFCLGFAICRKWFLSLVIFSVCLWRFSVSCKPAAYSVSDSAFLIQFLCSVLILFSLHQLQLTVSLYCLSSIQQSYFGLVVWLWSLLSVSCYPAGFHQPTFNINWWQHKRLELKLFHNTLEHLTYGLAFHSGSYLSK